METTSTTTRRKAGRQTKALLTQLAALPHMTVGPMPAPKGRDSGVDLYKVLGKMFAIVSLRGEPFVIVKCAADQVPFLKAQYQGIGHRSHLDPRFWISIALDTDVPTAMVKQLVQQSYVLVVATLTRQQRESLKSGS